MHRAALLPTVWLERSCEAVSLHACRTLKFLKLLQLSCFMHESQISESVAVIVFHFAARN